MQRHPFARNNIVMRTTFALTDTVVGASISKTLVGLT